MPHARVARLDTSAALAMPGVKAVLTADDLPKPSDSINDNGQVIFANLDGEVALTNEPVYQGQPILAVAAVDEVTAADAIEKIEIDFEPLPFCVDPLVSLRPGGPNARTKGNYWFIPPPAPPQQGAQGRGGQPQAPPRPEIKELKYSAAELAEAKDGQLPIMADAPEKWSYGDLDAGFKNACPGARRDIRDTGHQPPDSGNPDRHGVLAERQGVRLHRHAEYCPDRDGRRPMGRRPSRKRRGHQRVHRWWIRQQDHRRHFAADPRAAGEEGECPCDDA